MHFIIIYDLPIALISQLIFVLFFKNVLVIRIEIVNIFETKRVQIYWKNFWTILEADKKEIRMKNGLMILFHYSSRFQFTNAYVFEFKMIKDLDISKNIHLLKFNIHRRPCFYFIWKMLWFVWIKSLCFISKKAFPYYFPLYWMTRER